jgi:four helix bundle protein
MLFAGKLFRLPTSEYSILNTLPWGAQFQELKIWQRSMDLAETVYKLTSGFPREEKFGMISQLQRCSVSVPSNISEGAGRGTNKQFRQFLEMSMGSCNEVQTQLELSDLNILAKKFLIQQLTKQFRFIK